VIRQLELALDATLEAGSGDIEMIAKNLNDAGLEMMIVARELTKEQRQ
jgi:hypothetical protein